MAKLNHVTSSRFRSESDGLRWRGHSNLRHEFPSFIGVETFYARPAAQRFPSEDVEYQTL
jgi:hypothetical protein